MLLCHLHYKIACLALTEHNNHLESADFGYCKSKPSVLLESHLKSADYSLGQGSSQMILLFYWLPLIHADVMHELDPMKIKLVGLLRVTNELSRQC